MGDAGSDENEPLRRLLHGEKEGQSTLFVREVNLYYKSEAHAYVAVGRANDAVGVGWGLIPNRRTG